MQHPTAAMSPSWRSRAHALLVRLFRFRWRDTPSLVVWREMQPIDFEGDDTSLTERDLQVMK